MNQMTDDPHKPTESYDLNTVESVIDIAMIHLRFH